MQYEDTHATEATLNGVDIDRFDMVVLADESGRAPRYVYSTQPKGQPWAPRSSWRRLVVHVADVFDDQVAKRVLDGLGAELLDVPF